MAGIVREPERSFLNSPDATAAGSDWQRQALSFLSIFAVIGALTFNAVLCLVNTRLFPVSDSYVILGELAFIGSAMLVAADRKISFYLFFGLFVAYMILLFAMRHQFDFKAIRDVLIPFAFYFAGSRLADRKLANWLVAISVVIVFAIGMFEYLALERYLDYFNVLGYYLTRGTLTFDQAFGQVRGLFPSGLRPEPRTILPFLGQHRVSSVFLEPVSAGNFGVIAFAWTLFSKSMRWRWLVMAGALSIVLLADARFGLYTILLMTLLYPFFNLIARPIWLGLPFLALAILTIYGTVSGVTSGPNDIVGRFQVTAFLLNQLNAGVVFGSEAFGQFTADSGLAYSLTQFGIFGCIGLWALFVFAPAKDPHAWKFHSMAIIYFLLLLIISNSGYSIKTAALFWFILGTANHMAALVPSPQQPRSETSDLSRQPA